MQIVPMRDLKNTTKIERQCEDGPVYVTKNGYGCLVVMNMYHYEKAMNDIIEAKAVAEGLKDLREGRVSDGKEAVEKIRRKYGI